MVLCFINMKSITLIYVNIICRLEYIKYMNSSPTCNPSRFVYVCDINHIIQYKVIS